MQKNPPKELINKYLLLLSAVLIVFFFKLNALKDFSPTLYSDNAIYSILTQRFAHGDLGKAFHIYWQPLYPFLGSLILNWVGDARMALFYVSLFFGTLIIVPVFFIILEITRNKYLSLLGGILVTFHTQLVKSYFTLLTENLYICLLMFSIMFFILALSRNKAIFYAMSGAFFGLTYYARNDVLMPFELSIIFLGMLWLAKKYTRKEVIRYVLITGISFTILLLPYFYINIQKFGFLNLSAKMNAALNMPAYFSIYGNAKTIYAQEVWSIDTPNYDSHYFNKPFNFWKFKESMFQDSVGRAKHYFRLLVEKESIINLYIIFSSIVISFIYYFRYKKAFLILHFILLFYYIFLMPFLPGIDFRYVFWTYPLIIIMEMTSLFAVAKLISYLTQQKFKNRNTARLVLLLTTVFIYAFVINHLVKAERNSLTIPGEMVKSNQRLDMYKVPGEYIKSLGGKNPRIMTRREAISYYAEGETIYIPSSLDLNSLKEYAGIWKVDYIVANKETFPFDTALSTMIDENKSPDWLVPLKIWNLGIPKTIVYKVRLN